MRIKILGAAAGGGFPQWNCNCFNCAGARNGTIRAVPRTQSSIAVSADDVNWILFNASPDILTQIRATPALQPARVIRDTGIIGIVLTDSQIDHVVGLLMLREGRALEIYCTDAVHEDLTTGAPLFNILKHYCGVNRHPIRTRGDRDFAVTGAESLVFTAVPLRSKAPPYSPHRENSKEGDTVGIRVQDTRSGKVLFYAPGLGEIEPHVAPYLAESDCVLVDGTFWTGDELIQMGISTKPAHAMGHLPQSGGGGMIGVLTSLSRPRKILVHINNTNPILNEDSPERLELSGHGIEVGWDGMEIEL